MRRILCTKCASGFDLHPEDRADGLVIRKTKIAKAKRPEYPDENQITINGNVIPIPADEVICDSCNSNVYGQPAVAVSIWHGGRGEMDMWEDGFKG